MSNSLFPLISATFYEPGYNHFIEIIHQRDREQKRNLEKVIFRFYAADGRTIGEKQVDPAEDVVELESLIQSVASPKERVMVMIETLYDTRIFPYRPHQYAFFHRRGSAQAPVYYATNGVLGGVPNRVGSVAMNHFSVFMFYNQIDRMNYSVMLANPSRLADASIQVRTFYEGSRTEKTTCVLIPKQHVELPIASRLEGGRLLRAELNGTLRPLGYIVGRDRASRDIVHFDHFFSYLTPAAVNGNKEESALWQNKTASSPTLSPTKFSATAPI